MEQDGLDWEDKKIIMKNVGMRLLFICLVLTVWSCKQEQVKAVDMDENSESDRFKLSLAQWSFHKALETEELDNLEFAQLAADLGFEGVEYVNSFFKDKAEDIQYLNEMGVKAQQADVENVLIMVDGEGDLADPDSLMRHQAVENHYKWVDAAKYLGCHSIRVNLFGELYDKEAWKKYAINGLNQLAEYGQKEQINIIVENHGWLSSDAEALVEVIKQVDNPYCGTLPDFGNFCLERKDGELWGDDNCLKEYDKYKGVEELLPFAKAVSAKSYHFDSLGYETTIDYKKMMTLVKSSSYRGFIGVEYEGNILSEREGVLATKTLVESLISK
jgi:sugar phosphate isomerase/epimerase